jgi:O-glycosyl hydrolase
MHMSTKVIQSVLVAATLLIPAVSGFSAQVSDETVSVAAADRSDVIDGAGAFVHAARESLEKLQSLGSSANSADLNTAIRLTRVIQIGALDLYDSANAGASDEDLLDQHAALQDSVSQLDAVKRRLVARLKDSDLDKKLTYVRTTYFYLQLVLNGEV